MNIKKIETFIVRDKLSKSFFFSQWQYNERTCCLVKIITDDGNYGWVDGYGPANIVKEGIEFLKPILIGMKIIDNDVIWSKMYARTLDYARKGVLMASVSAIDIAVWDLKGKSLNLPVSTLLGGAYRNKIKPYATGLYFSSIENPSKNFEIELMDYLNRGFKAIKMKIGLGIEVDLKNIKYVRKVIGNDIKLMVDANHAYSLIESIELSKKMEKYDISWFEEPMSPEYYKQYKELREKTSIPVSAGECEYLRYGFHQLLENKSVDIIQPDICSCGGLSEAKKISSLASLYGIDIIPHTWGSGLGIYVALNFIANIEPNPIRLVEKDLYIEYDQTENSIREELIIPKLVLKDGYIDVPTSPGIGVDIDEEKLNHFKI